MFVVCSLDMEEVSSNPNQDWHVLGVKIPKILIADLVFQWADKVFYKADLVLIRQISKIFPHVLHYKLADPDLKRQIWFFQKQNLYF